MKGQYLTNVNSKYVAMTMGCMATLRPPSFAKISKNTTGECAT